MHDGCDGQYCPENCEKQEWEVAMSPEWETDKTLRVECGKKTTHTMVDKIKTDITFAKYLYSLYSCHMR